MSKALTDSKIKKAKSTEKNYKIYDGFGLYIIIAKSGGRWWRFKYSYGGKEDVLSFGTYPSVSLKEARLKRDLARKQLSLGVNPKVAQRLLEVSVSGADSFEFIAREWHHKFSETKWCLRHSENILNRLNNHIFPWIGARPINQISANEILNVFQRVEKTGHLHSLHRILNVCGKIFRYAIATNRADIDPTFKMSEAFPRPIEHHFSTLLNPNDIKLLLLSMENYNGSFVVKSALKLAILVFQRPSELRLAEWNEIDLDEAEWRIPIRRMKRLKRDKVGNPNQMHIVPLSVQAVSVLRELRPLTGHLRLLFPSERGNDRAISDATLIGALRRMGYSRQELHVHGFRAMARTHLEETLGFEEKIIEKQLGHAIKNANGTAYDRTEHLQKRIFMMQRWADYLDKLKNGEN